LQSLTFEILGLLSLSLWCYGFSQLLAQDLCRVQNWAVERSPGLGPFSSPHCFHHPKVIQDFDKNERWSQCTLFQFPHLRTSWTHSFNHSSVSALSQLGTMCPSE
jgi:hypothetical protein